MIFAGLVALSTSMSFAGDVFYTETSGGGIMRLSGRDLTSSFVARTRFGTQNPGLALDPATDTIWIYSPEQTDSLQSFNLTTLRWTDWGAQHSDVHALAYDSIGGRLIGFGTNPGGPLFEFPGPVPLLSPGLRFDGADWFDDGGYILAVDSATGDFYAVVADQVPVFLAPAPSELRGQSTNLGVAYDKDTRLVWEFRWTSGSVWILEPETFTVVGQLYTPLNLDGAGGSFDTVPTQTPDLLFTGQCPGTAWVTIVDATPGGHVFVGSSTTLGAHTVANGACAGAQLGLSSPRPRLDLLANSYGIASRRVEVSNPALCARFEHLQAMDVDTCLVTDVEERVMWLP